MASAHWRSGTRGRPPPKRWELTWTGRAGSSTAHRASEMRKPVVVGLFGVRGRDRAGFDKVLIQQYTEGRFGAVPIDAHPARDRATRPPARWVHEAQDPTAGELFG